jgi:exodeoxyribonuclease V gamma subunit
LQPFDSRTVTAGALGRPGPFTFDPPALEGALALSGPRRPVTVLVPRPLPPAAGAGADVELALLTALLVHPARGFLRQRLDVAVPFEQDDPPDDMPVQLTALEEWGVGDRLLRDRLAGVSEDECRQAEWRRGVLPPAMLGGRALERVLTDVRPLVDRTASLRAAPARTVEVSALLPDGRRVRGTVGGVHGSVLVGVTYSKLSAKARLQSWLSFLALTATDPSAGWSAATVGRADRGRPQSATLPPMAGARAGEVLADLVALYDAGLTAPLPLPLKTGERYAAARHRGDDHAGALGQAESAWNGSRMVPGENQDAANVRVWGREAALDALLGPQRAGQPAGSPAGRPGGGPTDGGGRTRDSGGGPAAHPVAEPNPFAGLAARIWFPLLEHEQRGLL